jgi:predicted nuclease of predicted toxin-antitoxin system
MLRFLLDENVREEVKEFLESKGFSAEYAPKGVVNTEIASLARERELVLITRDKDFLNTGLFPPKRFFGIVVFRIHPPTAERLIKGLSKLLEEVKEFKGKTFEVEEERIGLVESIKP